MFAFTFSRKENTHRCRRRRRPRPIFDIYASVRNIAHTTAHHGIYNI